MKPRVSLWCGRPACTHRWGEAPAEPWPRSTFGSTHDGLGRSLAPPPPGFTLLELMVVIVLVAILSAAILPEMRGTFAGATLRAAGRDLANLCALAASRSVSFNQIHRVRIDPATGRFGLEHQPRAARRETAFVPVRDVPHVRGQLDARLTARLAVPPDSGATRDATRPPAPLDRSAKEDAPADALVFYPDGTADPGAILLRHQDGSGLLLRVNPATARVRISDWSPP